MPREFFKAELFCLQCNQESIHKIEYNNKKIVTISCEGCGKNLSPYWTVNARPLPDHLTHKATVTSAELDKRAPVPSLGCYGKLMLSRIITKPSRLSEELHHDVANFICSMPVRVVTKPVRVAKELYTLKNIAPKAPSR